MAEHKKGDEKMTLTKKELDALLDCPDDNILIAFPKEKYGMTRRELRKIKKEEIHKRIIEDADYAVEQKRRTTENELREKANASLVQKIADLEDEIAAMAQIKKTPQEHKIIGKSNVKIEAIPFIIASDWHVEEEVRPETVSHLNEFNLDIAEKRIQNFFKNTLKLLKITENDVVTRQAVLALLGDFISGNIHEELMETCLLRPIDAMLWVQERLIGGIRYLLENTNLDFIIVCHAGNHPRITKRVHIANESGNSLEYFMYHNIKSVFEKEKRLTFIIAEGYHTYLELFGKTIRFHHGHSIKFNKNVGGIFPTVYKAIMQWNKGRKADLDIFGHFHQMRNGGNFICNGSLIGYNAFAVFITAEYEVPKQKFFLFTSNGEVTQECPIFLDM